MTALPQICGYRRKRKGRRPKTIPVRGGMTVNHLLWLE